MTAHWLKARLFFAPKDDQSRVDEHADRLLIDVIAPLLRDLRQREWISGSTWIRFSAEGYHLRLDLLGSEPRLRHDVLPLLQREWAAYTAAHPEIIHSDFRLPELSLKLNQKLGTDAALYKPGTLLTEIEPEQHIGVVYEDATLLYAHNNLHHQLGLHTIDNLARADSHALRKTLVSLYLDDMLRLTGLTPAERYRFLSAVQDQWINYFDLRPQLERYRDRYQKNGPRMLQFYQSKRDYHASLSLVPESLHAQYSATIAMLAANIPSIIQRDEHGALTQQTILRLMSVFHLSNNRFGIDLIDEVYLAFVMAQYYATLIDEHERQAIDAEYSAPTAIAVGA